MSVRRGARSLRILSIFPRSHVASSSCCTTFSSSSQEAEPAVQPSVYDLYGEPLPFISPFGSQQVPIPSTKVLDVAVKGLLQDQQEEDTSGRAALGEREEVALKLEVLAKACDEAKRTLVLARYAAKYYKNSWRRGLRQLEGQARALKKAEKTLLLRASEVGPETVSSKVWRQWKEKAWREVLEESEELHRGRASRKTTPIRIRNRKTLMPFD